MNLTTKPKETVSSQVDMHLLQLSDFAVDLCKSHTARQWICFGGLWKLFFDP
ncbi:MAG: hypothetical protein V7K48_28920 [Nostoc sp.]|uniref:hypothetical protein n=1 Tax=Nostoc sp. TaxID=1180 RepID=UPI002FFC66D5